MLFLVRPQLARLLGVLLFLIALPAPAGDYHEKNGAALAGYDPVAYFTEGKPLQGSAAFTHVHKGSTFRFATAANRNAFAAEPERYAPQYGGYCAYGTTRGYKAAIDPASFSIVDGKLYLNYNRKVQETWAADAQRNIAVADEKWPEVARTEKVIE